VGNKLTINVLCEFQRGVDYGVILSDWLQCLAGVRALPFYTPIFRSFYVPPKDHEVPFLSNTNLGELSNIYHPYKGPHRKASASLTNPHLPAILTWHLDKEGVAFLPGLFTHPAAVG
jgi:hypothetical protein